MEDDSDLNFCSSKISSSSSCITNDVLQKECSEMQIKTSYCNPGKHPPKRSQEHWDAEMYCEECKRSNEPLCHIKLESVDKLKESTKQLLCLLEEIQSKIHGKNVRECLDRTPKFTKFISSYPFASKDDDTTKEIFNTKTLQHLKVNAKKLDAIYIEDDQDNCSVYRRLTRKCHCLNHPEYNDFVIHFNEESKYTTSNLGEIIKNMRILRKFLYMGGSYTKNALMFLNEGLMESPHSERLEMTQACTNADICSIFDEYSIVIVCISWPCKYKHNGDYVTQALAAGFLYKLAQIEEGRRYLNYSSKITNDIKKVLRKKSASIEIDTIDSLNATLNLLKPVFTKNMTISNFKLSIYEGVGKRTVSDLAQNRQHMTYDEIRENLKMLDIYSQYDNGKTELTSHLPLMLILFKNLILEHNNSEINITIISIINSIVSKKIAKQNGSQKSNASNTAHVDTSTQAVNCMKNEQCQFPPKKSINTKRTKHKTSMGIAPSKLQSSSRRKVLEWESTNIRMLNRSKKFNEHQQKSIIIVPMEKLSVAKYLY